MPLDSVGIAYGLPKKIAERQVIDFHEI